MATQKRRGWQRRSHLVTGQSFQLGFAWRLLAVQAAIVLGYQATLQLWLSRSLARNLSEETQAVLHEMLKASLWTGAGVFVVGGVLVFALGIWFSHRIVGPIPRLRQAMQLLATGNTNTRLKFRPEDSMAYLADDFNAMAQALEMRQGGQRVFDQVPTSRDSSENESTISSGASLWI